MDIKQLANYFQVLGNENRIKIFQLLVTYAETGLKAGEISTQLNIPTSTTSFHLSNMEKAGILNLRKDGRFWIYFVDINNVKDIISELTKDCCKYDSLQSDCLT